MLRLSALALATFGVSIAGGFALGGYTIGGFRTASPPPDILRQLTGVDQDFETDWPEPAPAPIVYTGVKHVCKGCDAGLYRDEWRYAEYEAYDPYAYDAPYPDPAVDSGEAWDDVGPASGHYRDTRTSGASRAGDMDQAAVMDAYEVSLPVVARAEPAPSRMKQGTRADPSAQPVAVASLQAPVVSAKLDAPAVVVGLRSR